MIRYKLDPSTTTVVGVCREHGCGFRALSSTRAQAIRTRDQHEEIVHMVQGRRAADCPQSCARSRTSSNAIRVSAAIALR